MHLWLEMFRQISGEKRWKLITLRWPYLRQMKHGTILLSAIYSDLFPPQPMPEDFCMSLHLEKGHCEVEPRLWARNITFSDLTLTSSIQTLLSSSLKTERFPKKHSSERYGGYMSILGAVHNLKEMFTKWTAWGSWKTIFWWLDDFLWETDVE